MQTVAIVLLNWNGLGLLQKFLPTVVKYSSNAQIYIADNASTDDSKNFVSANYPSVKWIQLSENFGFAKGYNEALKFVNEDILCLLNTDVEVTENWLQPILNLFETNTNIGIIQPKILDYKNKTHFEYAGAAGGFIDAYGFPFCRGRIFDTIEKDENQYASQEIFWASGACFFIRNSVFKQLNGFDDAFFAHQEEIDLCWRAFNANITTYYCNESKVYHVGGATLKKSNPKKTFLNFRNSLFMLYKNLPRENRFSIIFKRLCLDGIAGAKLFLSLQPLHTFAIIKAHFSYYAHLNQLKSKQISLPKTNYFYTKNIVYSYFISKRKKFTNIL
ncbi:glycosyltransferase family 2 protein [Flavobacterium sp. xlx-214]|uniref:glycosyltransferase family 2 protein n=1 Tax=unclassified Flavobacterium TaxID=196869 RepID=UPI0013D79D22|nr:MULTISPECIES: glycosyltransferase family 2 protein [unclassified Flavobacterium]MBA5793273.1 glycosyltransferase family 2 protein [Flavobacterium sp. xlx-221]QMI82445.1 glycosyltransferase family 2 protein [Flavobacterium sp. xlx-214]